MEPTIEFSVALPDTIFINDAMALSTLFPFIIQFPLFTHSKNCIIKGKRVKLLNSFRKI